MRILDSTEISGFSFHQIKLPFLFGRQFDGRLERERGFKMKGLADLGKCLRAGQSLTRSALNSGVGRKKATAFRKVIVSLFGEIYCKCGRQSNHVMGCKWRYDQSPAWQKSLRAHQRPGSHHPASKLNDLQIQQIRELRALSWTLKDLSVAFKVSRGTIYNIFRRG